MIIDRVDATVLRGDIRAWSKRYLVAAAAVLASMTAVPSSSAFAAGAQTAQGIMVNVVVPTTLTIVSTEVYRYDTAVAASFFSNAWNGSSPTSTCTGPGCGTPPSAPSAPPPDQSQVSGPSASSSVNVNQCMFFTGGTVVGKTYTQTSQVTTGSGPAKATYTYTYTYNIIPVLNPVDPRTAWFIFLQTNPDGTVPLSVDANIAGESVVKNSNPKIGTKYSFSMLESDGSNRVIDLVWAVYAADNSLRYSTPTNSSVNFPEDFFYKTNAGSNGYDGLHKTPSLLQDGDARTILNADDFLGNNNGGADGSALALAHVDRLQVNLSAGDYTVILSGTVKGNTIDTTGTGADISFSISHIVHIIALGCGPQSPPPSE